MRATRPQELRAVIKLDGPDRFEHLVRQVAADGAAWGLWGEGWALMEDGDGQRTFPLWPAKAYAELLAEQDWAGYRPRPIPVAELLELLLPKLEEAKLRVGVFPVPAGRAVSVPATELAEALRAALVKPEG